jgi:hypothetical protein
MQNFALDVGNVLHQQSITMMLASIGEVAKSK